MASSSSSPPTRTDWLADDATQRDDGDLGGAAADVDNHVPRGLVHRQPCSDGGGHGLLDDVSLAGTGVQGGLHDGTLLDPGDARGTQMIMRGLAKRRWWTRWMK